MMFEILKGLSIKVRGRLSKNTIETGKFSTVVILVILTGMTSTVDSATTNLSTLNETLAFLDAVKQGHQDYNQQHDDSKGDSKDHHEILVDVLYASIVDYDVLLDVV